MHFQDFWDSCVQNKTSEISNNGLSGILGILRTSEISKNDFHEFWGSCAQNKTSGISKHALSGIMGLLCAEQNVGNLKNVYSHNFGGSCAQNKKHVGNLKQCTFRNSGTPVRRTKRRKSQTNALSRTLGLLCAEQTVGSLKKCTVRNSGTPVCRTNCRKSQEMHF